MKIAVGVHGRFHAFELARSLREIGEDATLFTNYPKRVVRRWDVPPEAVHSYAMHGALFHFLIRAPANPIEHWLHRSFGAWFARELSRDEWDVVHCFAGVAQESFEALVGSRLLKTLMRGSAHIRTQQQLLAEETERSGIDIRPAGQWRLEREETEYDLADRVVVLSSFARKTFVDQGVDEDKIWTVPLGVRVERFRVGSDAIEARAKRISSGTPLRVLFVGTVSARKGLWDIKTMAKALPLDQISLRMVGPVEGPAREAAAELADVVEFISKEPEAELRKHYEWADVFLFPTIEDGFAVVLLQAFAAGLPIIATENCSAPDFVTEGKDGWIVPIRRPDLLAGRLLWCLDNRSALAQMVEARREEATIERTWAQVARDFVDLCAGSREVGNESR